MTHHTKQSNTKTTHVTHFVCLYRAHTHQITINSTIYASFVLFPAVIIVEYSESVLYPHMVQWFCAPLEHHSRLQFLLIQPVFVFVQRRTDAGRLLLCTTHSQEGTLQKQPLLLANLKMVH